MNERVRRVLEAMLYLESLDDVRLLVTILKDQRSVMPLGDGRFASYDGLGELKDHWGREEANRTA